MAVNKRLLVLNVCASYVRTLVSIGLTLFSVRWLIAALGAQDYGLYFVVGGLATCLSFFNAALQAGASRYFSFAMGQNSEEVRLWFSTSFYIHLVCALSVFVLAVPVYFISFRVWLVIPFDRVDVCKLVYWTSVASTCFSIVNVPFSSIFVARQRIFELTFMQTLNTVLLFALAWTLLRLNGDRLAFYAVGGLAIHLVIYMVQALRCLTTFQEARVVPFVRLPFCRFKSMLTFSFWTLSDALAFMARGQGLQLLFNRYGVGGLNASYSVANQLSAQTNVLSGAVTAALAPGIVAQYGSGDVQNAGSWCLRMCKLATMLALVVFIPLFCEADYIVKMWLVTPPVHCANLVRAMSITYLVTQFVTGGNTLIKATGVIGGYTRVTAVCYILSLLVSVALIPLGVCIENAIYVFMASTIGYAIATLFFACGFPGFLFYEWLVRVFLPGIGIALVAAVASLGLRFFMEDSFLRLIFVGCGAIIMTLSFSWSLMFSQQERGIVVQKFLHLVRGVICGIP